MAHPNCCKTIMPFIPLPLIPIPIPPGFRGPEEGGGGEGRKGGGGVDNAKCRPEPTLIFIRFST